MSTVKTAAQLKKEAKAKRQAAAAIRGVAQILTFLVLVKYDRLDIFPVAGGAVAAKDKKVETDEIAEVVDEAAAALRELTASSSVSKSVADTQLAAARNVTGRQVHHRNESLQHRRISALIFCMALQAFWVLIRCHAILKYCHSRWVFTAHD